MAGVSLSSVRMASNRETYQSAWGRLNPRPFFSAGRVADAPKFDHVLRNDTEPVATAQKRHNGASSVPVGWACVLDAAQQNVGVNEVIHRPGGT